MIRIRSNLTGQTLFCLETVCLETTLSPTEARELLEFLANSSLSKQFRVTLSGTGIPVTPSDMFGGAAVESGSVEFDYEHSRSRRQAYKLVKEVK